MENFINTTFDLAAQFTGGRGGIEHGIVHFGIPAFLWAVCLVFALIRRSRKDLPHENLLVWGFGLGLARELFMIFMSSLVAYGLVVPERLHVIFPPLEHAVFDVALVVIAAAFMRYLLEDRSLSVNYMKAGVVMVVLVYLATFWWWAGHITANPESRFGQTWCDWAFRANASILLAYPIVVLMKKTGGWVRNAVVVALVFFFLNQFLKIPDMALGEVYEGYFAPVRHGLYHLAIPLLFYVYIREMYERHLRTEMALQHSESKFRTLFESVNDGIFILDFDGRFIDVNMTACDKLGYTREEILSMTIQQLDPPAMAKLVPERLERVREEGKALFESAHRCKDGSVMPVEISATAFDLEGRRVLLSVIRDITERKKTEEELLQVRDRVIEEMTRHSEYVQEIADRLRNPLQKLKGYLEIFEEGELSPEQRAFLTNVKESGLSIEEGIKKLT